MAPASFMISRSNVSLRAAISTRVCSFSWQKVWAASTMARSSSLSCSDSRNGSSQLNLAFMADLRKRGEQVARLDSEGGLSGGHEYLSNIN